MPKIELSEALVMRNKLREDIPELSKAEREKKQWRNYYLQCTLHAFIPLYGLGIMVFQFWNPMYKKP